LTVGETVIILSDLNNLEFKNVKGLNLRKNKMITAFTEYVSAVFYFSYVMFLFTLECRG